MKTNFNKTIFIALLTLICISNNINAQTIAAGGWHSLTVCNDSTVKAFGENETGQLGNGTNTDSNIPVTAVGLSSIVSVSGGGDQQTAHSLALKSDGTVWSWGGNVHGELGNGTVDVNTNVPGQVVSLSGITAISAGGWHSVALRNNGTVYAWGFNEDGQLGDGTLVDKTVPVVVSGLTNVKAIAAGTYHTLVLKNDSTVWAWGDNISGQIGDGSTADRITPVQVVGLTRVVKIAAGRFFSLAVKSDGTVWTWGENLYGQLGNGTTTNSSFPVQVIGLTGITSATAATGAFHCMAVKNDNTVWAWGRNSYGNIGDNTVEHRYTPVQMIGITDVEGMAAGTNFSLLYKNDGTFWACGRNASGQLGDGSNTQRNTPVQSTMLCPILQISGFQMLSESNFIEVSTFPNPSIDGKFYIELKAINNKITESKIEVYNVNGKKVFETIVDCQNINQTITIDISNQLNGIYFMTLKSDSNIFYQKLVKN